MKPIGEMSPTEKATWMLSIYNAQYADYQVQAAREDLTESEKNILREKKKILTEVYPLIRTYSAYVESGALPDAEVEAMIMQLLNKLLAM